MLTDTDRNQPEIAMELFEKATGRCEIRGSDVEILMVRLKKGKQKAGTLTPVRCQSSADCPRGAFCKFVNPLTTRIPVNLSGVTGEAEAS